MSVPRAFRPLAQLLGIERDRTKEPLFGLTPEQVGALRSWRASSEFALYLALLDTTITLYAEALLGARDDAALHEYRGLILGLRKAASLVDETLRQEDELERARQHEQRTERDRAERRLAATYASPQWGRAARGV